MRKEPAQSPVDSEDKVEACCVEATLLWANKDAYMAMCSKGLIYRWEVRTKDGMEPGDLVQVVFDKKTGTVFSINPST